jgi:uncharacterized YigZ family protein
VASYWAPARAAEAEIEVRRSRFRCRVERVSTESEARSVVEAARRTHWDARHHCSAFVLGPSAAVTRSSDDGEPAGTAGAPMLQVLLGAGVSDVVAVVTRWFGGTLLGAGGLVRAYGDAVRAALQEAGTVERRRLDLFEVVTDHAHAARLENDLRARGVVVRDTAYAERVTLTLAADPRAGLAALVAAVTGGASTAELVGHAWVDGPG